MPLLLIEPAFVVLRSVFSGGKTGVDQFRIKITEGDTVVYDNQMGAEENGSAATEISGGSIVIHK